MRNAARRQTPSIHDPAREARKRLWLDPVFADLQTAEAAAVAKKEHVSVRLVRQIAGLIVNLNSFLDDGYVYASQVGLAKHITGSNDHPVSDRQVRRGLKVLEDRKHLQVDRRRGTNNRMRPLYRQQSANPRAAGLDERQNSASDNLSFAESHRPVPDHVESVSAEMSSDQGHHVLTVRTSCPPNPFNKPSSETEAVPPLPPAGRDHEGGGQSLSIFIRRERSDLARTQGRSMVMCSNQDYRSTSSLRSLIPPIRTSVQQWQHGRGSVGLIGNPSRI